MGILDFFRRKRPIDPTLLQALKDYKQRIRQGEEDAVRSREAVFGGLQEREVSLLMAADAGLIEAPAHLAPRLNLYQSKRLEMERSEAEAGAAVGAEVDALQRALDFLLCQQWWADFIASVRHEKGIRTADDIGRWGIHGQQLAPYVWECGFSFQTPEAATNNGPVSVWSWRVDLEDGTVTQTAQEGAENTWRQFKGKANTDEVLMKRPES